MKIFKTMMAVLTALMITFSVNAQSAAAPAAKPAASQSTPAKPNGDARTKTGDKINKDLKGPKGETVYTGPKGGNYYLDASGNKKYIPKKADAAPASAPAAAPKK